MTQNKIERVLITGAAGFIGYFTAKRLIKEGVEVVGLDNMNTYYDPELKALRRGQLVAAGVSFIEADINDSEKMNHLFSTYQFDAVIHLAAQAGVRYSTEHPLQFVQDNLTGFIHILEHVKNQKGCKLLFASSSSVYGKNTEYPYKESDVVTRPASFYAATKSAGELLAHSYHHLHGIAMYGLRFFTVYGPMGRPDMAYYIFAEKMCQGQEIEVFNYGNMERDFTYIDDIVDGIVGALFHIQEGDFEMFNLGGDHTYKIGEMIESLKKHLGLKAQTVMKPTPLGDVEKTCSDITKATKAFGYRPKVSLDEGLSHFCQWYLQYTQACHTT